MIHKARFFVWFAVMAIHVLGHVVETAKLAPLDFGRRTRAQAAGASARQWSIVAALVVGSVLGAAMLGPTTTYLHQTAFSAFTHNQRDLGLQAAIQPLAEALPCP